MEESGLDIWDISHFVSVFTNKIQDLCLEKLGQGLLVEIKFIQRQPHGKVSVEVRVELWYYCLQHTLN